MSFVVSHRFEPGPDPHRVGKEGRGAADRRRVLVADDQHDVLVALRLLLKGDGYETETVDSPKAVLAAVKARHFDLLLMDLNYARDTTSGREGLELIPRLRTLDPALPVLVMTAWGSIDLAVEAMRRGATDFVTKPWENRSLLERVRSHLSRANAESPAQEGPGGVARDLTAAGRVQARMRPQGGPTLRTLEYAGQCDEAEAVGGDGYDFIDLGGGRMGLLLADVAGKGVSAALLMAHLQATVRSLLVQGDSDLPALLEKVNGLFHSASTPERYATAFLGVYDDQTRRLCYVNCGHNPPLLLHADDRVDALPASATVLGLMEDWQGRAEEVQIERGDTLLVFSDGVSEAQRAEDGEEFGEARLHELLRRLRHRPIAAMPAALLAAIETFGGIEAEDDRTVVVARGR
jgi:phosphoserine phosphatase RsbU/P